jgi:putative transposase
MTTRKRHTPEQVVRKFTQADRLLGEGKDVADVCREAGVAEQTYYRWRNQFGGLKADDAKKLKDPERANAALKRLLADAELGRAPRRNRYESTSSIAMRLQCRATRRIMPLRRSCRPHRSSSQTARGSVPRSLRFRQDATVG